MSEYIDKNCHQGFRLKVTAARQAYWSPNRMAVKQGGMFELVDNDVKADLIDKVLREYPKGHRVRITETREILAYDEDNKGKKSLTSLGFLSAFPKLDKLQVDSTGLTESMIWKGPYCGEIHSLHNNKMWTKDIHGRRLFWEEVPEKLMKTLKKYKPDGGRIRILNGNVITLINPMPLPATVSAREQWENMTKDEQHLLLIKQDTTAMLPIFIGKLEDFTDDPPKFQKPYDYSQPLSKEEKDVMGSFLQGFGSSNSPFTQGDYVETEEDEDLDMVEESWGDLIDDDLDDENTSADQKKIQNR